MSKKDQTYSSSKFLTVFTIGTLFLLSVIGTISYVVDPFFQFRVREGSHYFLNPRLVNGGLMRNYDYNLVVIGSSMVQNYDMSILRQMEGVRPLKIATGGMSVDELEYSYSFADKSKVNRFILNLDAPQFNVPYPDMRYPRHLYEDSWLNKLQYLFGYDTFMQFVPTDIGLDFYLRNKDDIPFVYKVKTDINYIGNNSLEGHYGNAEYVKNLYLSGKNVSFQVSENMEERMQARYDSLLSRIALDKHKEIKYTFVLPPYSALYWVYTEKEGYYKQFMNFVRYVAKRTEQYPNARVLLFFDIDEITDLNNYTDISHFSPILSDKILHNIDNPEYELNSRNMDARIQRIDSLKNVFKVENKNWLPQK